MLKDFFQKQKYFIFLSIIFFIYFLINILSKEDFLPSVFLAPAPLDTLYKLLFLIDLLKAHLLISNLPYVFFIQYVFFIFLILYFILLVMFTHRLDMFKTKKIFFYYTQALLILFLMICFTLYLINMCTLWDFNYELLKQSVKFKVFREGLIHPQLEGRLWLTITILFFGFLGLIVSRRSIPQNQNSIFFLIFILGSILGGLGMVIASDWFFLYLNLELLTFCFLFLIGIKKNIRSIEASLKYFLISVFSSFFLLFGLSYIYFIFGTLEFKLLECFLSSPNALLIDETGVLVSILKKGLLFIIVSFAIKLGAAPFHMWVPDVYEGAPSFATLFLIILPKIPTFSVLTYLMFSVFQNYLEFFQIIFFFIGSFSLLVGSFGALGQVRLKRMLAYSSVADTGFLFLGLSTGTLFGLQSLFFYLFLYSFFSVLLWGIIIWFEAQFREETIISRTDLISGKYTSGLLLLPLISALIGLPPFIGFWSKWVILVSAIKAQLFLGVVIFLFGSILSSVYYLRLLKVSFFEKKKLNLKWFTQHSQDILSVWVISFLVVLLLYFSVDPKFLLLLCQKIVLNLVFVSY